jgi:NhaP-type Na+/H+ or K+/H+ antiporter
MHDYPILSLTVIRILPVAICLMGTRLGWLSIGFIGWFGPRGIASVLYLLQPGRKTMKLKPCHCYFIYSLSGNKQRK